MREIRLEALVKDGKPVLYDIYIKDKWMVSRRTLDACATFLGLKKEHLLRLAGLK